MKKILIIHPEDRTTRFLNRIKHHVRSNFENNVHIFNIKCNDLSHEQCLDRIDSHPENGVIIYLGHGTTVSLSGSKGDGFYTGGLASSDALCENPEFSYGRDVFIDAENVSVFKGKKIFCLACNSNDKIAKYALEGGASCFLGFGNIPTSLSEFKELKENVTMRTVIHMKTEVSYIVKKSLAIALANGYSFEKLHHYLNFISNQRINNILINRKDLKERKIIADYIYSFKNELRIFGDKKKNLIDN